MRDTEWSGEGTNAWKASGEEREGEGEEKGGEVSEGSKEKREE